MQTHTRHADLGGGGGGGTQLSHTRTPKGQPSKQEIFVVVYLFILLKRELSYKDTAQRDFETSNSYFSSRL
jgi:hypothetical protein